MNTLEPINLDMMKKLDYSKLLFNHTSFVGYTNYACGPTVNLLSNETFTIETSYFKIYTNYLMIQKTLTFVAICFCESAKTTNFSVTFTDCLGTRIVGGRG